MKGRLYLYGMKRAFRSFVVAALVWAGLAPLGAVAHPHALVTTTMVFDLDADQRITGVTMTWEYDDFFSLLILEDKGMDRDADGQLTESELDQLMGFDLEVWPEGFEGDLYLTSGGTKIDMPRPTPHDIDVKDRKIIATHKRKIPPVPAHGLQIKQFDPTYYVSYDLSGGIEVPAPCAVRIQKADVDAAESIVAQIIEEQSGSNDIFVDVELGHLYADIVVLACGG